MRPRLGPLFVCSGCKEAKPATEDFFYPAKGRGLSAHCKVCRRARDMAPERVARRKAAQISILANRRANRVVLTVADRFWSKVDKDGPLPAHVPELGRCWRWTGSVNSDGYGKLGVAQGRLKPATHVAWYIEKGEWPKQWMLHRCDNPSCVRVSHLFEGDNTENVRDCIAKGRRPLTRMRRKKKA